MEGYRIQQVSLNHSLKSICKTEFERHGGGGSKINRPSSSVSEVFQQK